MNVRAVTEVVRPKTSAETTTTCSHCGDVMPKQGQHYVLIDNVRHPMCCIGCLTAAEFIREAEVLNKRHSE